MKNFLVLYMAPIETVRKMMQTMTPADQEKDMEQWKEWMDKHKAHFADQGAPVGKNTRVTRESAEEHSNDIMGYSIMQAESKEELLKILAESSHLDMSGAYTEVMECGKMP